WQENGFLIALTLPEAGVMETEWAENRAKLPQDVIRGFLGKILDSIYSTSERDKFRTRLEREHEGEPETHVSHRGMIEVSMNNQRTNQNDATTIWQPRLADPQPEAEFLRRMMIRLGTKDEVAKQQVASAPQAPARAAIQQGIGGFET